MKTDLHYSANKVCPDERLARIVLSPRDIDQVTGRPKDTFIGLRQNESGISFLRKDYMGETNFRKSGLDRATLYNGNSKKKRISFVGWVEGVACEIEALAPGVIHINVNEPNIRPEHVNIQFHKDGDLVRGIVTDAEILDIIDELFHYLKYVVV